MDFLRRNFRQRGLGTNPRERADWPGSNKIDLLKSIAPYVAYRQYYIEKAEKMITQAAMQQTVCYIRHDSHMSGPDSQAIQKPKKDLFKKS